MQRKPFSMSTYGFTVKSILCEALLETSDFIKYYHHVIIRRRKTAVGIFQILQQLEQ
jgi:hypothetical protein